MKKENLKEKKNIYKKKKAKRFKPLVAKKFLFKESQKFKFREKSKTNRLIILFKKLKSLFKNNEKDNKSIPEERKNKKKGSINYKNILKKTSNISRKIILFLNLIILLMNTCLLFNILISTRVNNKLYFNFSDSFNFNLFIKPYEAISSYLNNKFYSTYFNNTNMKNKNLEKTKKEVRIRMVGLYEKEFHHQWVKQNLEDEFKVKFTKHNPDYLIYNTMTSHDRTERYPNIIRIALYTENIMPDINYADYVFAHYHINYLDRYFKTSIFLRNNFSQITKVRKEVLKNPNRTKFCGAVISNCKAEFRLKFIEKLSEYKTVDMGGGCGNNIKKRVGNKDKFLRNYKFSIAMENSNGDGYVTEKIVNALAAGTIPIYYGDYLVDEFINPKTYILVKGEKDIDAKIEYIKKIDNDDKLYKKMLKEKPIIDDKFMEKIEIKEGKEFLKNIFRQDKNKAFRRDNQYYDFHC